MGCFNPPKTIKKSIIKSNNDLNNINKIRQNRQNMHSYFDTKEQRGTDWLDNMDSKKMIKESKQIIRDLVNCNIDLEKHSHYFLEYLIWNSVMNEADMQYKRNWCDKEAYQLYLNCCAASHIVPHQDYAARFHEINVCLSLYTKIIEMMWNIQNTKEPFVHLSNFYAWVSNSDGKFFINNDMADFVRENYMDE